MSVPVDENTSLRLISIIESVENDLRDYESFLRASREALKESADDFAKWYERVVLDSIEDHGYWASPFASYSELADLNAIANALREGDISPLLAHEHFGTGSHRQSSIAATCTSNGHEVWDRSSRLKYLARVLGAALRSPGVATLNESLPRVIDFDDSRLEPSEIEARKLLKKESRRGCVFPFLSGRPPSNWLEAIEKARAQLLIEAEK